MIIGLTGGIACGKSTVSDKLKEYGYEMIDTDALNRIVIEYDHIIEEISSEFGKDLLIDGKIDRKKLASIVFSDKSKLDRLDEIMGKEILNLINEEIEKNHEVLIVECAVLFEKKINEKVNFDHIILVDVEEEVQIERLISRNNLSREEAIKRVNSQYSRSRKLNLSDIIINNSGSIEKLDDQIKLLTFKLSLDII